MLYVRIIIDCEGDGGASYRQSNKKRSTGNISGMNMNILHLILHCLKRIKRNMPQNTKFKKFKL